MEVPPGSLLPIPSSNLPFLHLLRPCSALRPSISTLIGKDQLCLSNFHALPSVISPVPRAGLQASRGFVFIRASFHTPCNTSCKPSTRVTNRNNPSDWSSFVSICSAFYSFCTETFLLPPYILTVHGYTSFAGSRAALKEKGKEFSQNAIFRYAWLFSSLKEILTSLTSSSRSIFFF